MDEQQKLPGLELPDLSSEYIFDKYSVSKEIMSKPDGTSFAAPEGVVTRNVMTLNHWLEIWGYNMSLNMATIMSDFDVDLHTRKAKRDAGTDNVKCLVERPDLCIIAGSGPSLEQYLPFFRAWPGYIVCAPTNLLAFLAHGVVPHFCIAVDCNPELGLYVANAAEVPGAETCKLLLPVTADPEMALAWPFERYWHLDFIQGGRGLNNPFNSFQCIIFPFIVPYLTQAGNVVNSAVMLPLLWGKNNVIDIRKVFLFGVDGGFPLGVDGVPRCRIPYWKYDSIHREFDKHAPRSIDSQRSSPLVTSANGTLTEQAQLGYKRSLVAVWWSTFFRDEEEKLIEDKKVSVTRDFTEEDRAPGMNYLYTCSEGILEDTIPHVDGMEVLTTSGSCAKPYTRELVNAAYKHYMEVIAVTENEEDVKKEEKTP